MLVGRNAKIVQFIPGKHQRRADSNKLKFGNAHRDTTVQVLQESIQGSRPRRGRWFGKAASTKSAYVDMNAPSIFGSHILRRDKIIGMASRFALTGAKIHLRSGVSLIFEPQVKI
jgi:hypothetical protein